MKINDLKTKQFVSDNSENTFVIIYYKCQYSLVNHYTFYIL